MNAKLFFVMWTVLCGNPEAPVPAAPFSNPVEMTYYCCPPWGDEYASTITREMRNSSPAWADTEPNPPLSARKAMTLAEATLRASSKKEIDPVLERSLVGVRLVPLDGKKKKWCWEVSYEWHRCVGGETGTPYSFRVFVLMNGKVAQPKIVGKWNGMEMNKDAQKNEKSKGNQKKKTQEKDKMSRLKTILTPSPNNRPSPPANSEPGKQNVGNGNSPSAADRATAFTHAINFDHPADVQHAEPQHARLGDWIGTAADVCGLGVAGGR
jgi:hypothetical protein